MKLVDSVSKLLKGGLSKTKGTYKGEACFMLEHPDTDSMSCYFASTHKHLIVNMWEEIEYKESYAKDWNEAADQYRKFLSIQ